MAATAGAPADRITIIHPGVDPAVFQPGPKSPELVRAFHLENRKVLLSLSRLSPYKGLDTLIRAMRFIVREHPDAIYLIGGKGPDYARLRRLVRALELNSHVRFVGKIPPARLNDYYRLCDLFCLLSREDKETPKVEGFGIVLLEAAACGKPALAGNSGGIPDAVEDGVTGWLVNPKDPREVADTVCRLLDAPSRLKTAGDAAHARTLERFTWRRSAKTLLQVIRRDVVGCGAPRSSQGREPA